MQINWKVRLKNKLFWIAVIPQALLIISIILKFFGVSFDAAEAQVSLVEILEAVFVILGAMGIVVDPTTSGISDSNRAMSYEEPYDDAIANEEKQGK